VLSSSSVSQAGVASFAFRIGGYVAKSGLKDDGAPLAIQVQSRLPRFGLS
jgi:hypothetical protein